MLKCTVRSVQRHRLCDCTFLRLSRCLSVEALDISQTDPSPPPPPPKQKSPSRNSRLASPAPRPSPNSSPSRTSIRSLPSNFGQNQLLPVAQSTRALLEKIVSEFNAPIRYAFAYGSGVFEQDGYKQQEGPNPPMLDFIFAVSHPAHWHSINLSQHPAHYSFHSRLLGSDFVSTVQRWGPGVWFNAYVPISGVNIKYGVTTVDNLCSELLSWPTLYLSGRMHKPIRIIKDDARVRLTQQVNLTSALRVALLTLPETFTEQELFECIASISYSGDPRMWLPAENRAKIRNIVRTQTPQFKDLYRKLAVGLPGVHWPLNSTSIQQDISAQVRSNHLKKLPSTLLKRLSDNYVPSTRAADEDAYFLRFAADPRLSQDIHQEIRRIVRVPATLQAGKGFLSAGLGQSVRYAAGKVMKYWRGGSTLER